MCDLKHFKNTASPHTAANAHRDGHTLGTTAFTFYQCMAS
jgi:hypothetical protein